MSFVCAIQAFRVGECTIRQALGDKCAKPRFVETIPKRGYRLLAAVSGLQGENAMSTPPTRLAVLPFLNLSGCIDMEHVADGMTDLLIAHLASRPFLRVVARTSSMHYKHTRRRLVDIARELDVTRIVEGSILPSTHAMQVVVQLVDPMTETHLMSRIYVQEGEDAPRLRDEVTLAIAGEIEAALRARPGG